MTRKKGKTHSTSRFMTELQVQKVKRRYWRLTSELIYHSELVGLVTVPVGFVTDFASVPRLPIAFLLVGDTAHTAAVIHDYLYRVNKMTRKRADEVFLEAMNAESTAKWRRRIMYLTVRLGGRRTWKRYRENEVSDD